MSRPGNQEFQEWWNNQREEDLLLSDKPQKTRPHLTVEIPPTPPADFIFEKDRPRTVRQLSYVFLLKFQQLANYFTNPSNFFNSFYNSAKRRLNTPESPTFIHARPYESRLYRVIKVFFVILVLLLVFELLAYLKGWHFSPPSVGSWEIQDFVEHFYAYWLHIRAYYLAPPLQLLTNVCIVMFLVQSFDRLILVLGFVWIKIWRIKPVAEMEYKDGIDQENVEAYPMVLVQIPMCNEREVRKCSIVLHKYLFSGGVELIIELVPQELFHDPDKVYKREMNI